MKKALLTVAALIALGGCFLVFPQTADPLDSLVVCKDTQTLLFENTFVKVIDDKIPPGFTEPRHRHRHGVVVYLTDYPTEIEAEDGKTSQFSRKFGTAGWSDAVIHKVKNTGAITSHAIRIELKF